MYEFTSVGELPPPQPSPSGGVKRDRDSDTGSPCSTQASFSPSSTQSHEGPRVIAGSRRVNRGGSPTSRQYPLPVANLPVYSNDLGRLPIHGQVNLSVPSPPHSSAAPALSAGLEPSTGGVWYPQYHAHAHSHDHQDQRQHQRHHPGVEDPSAHLASMARLPYPPTVPSHTPLATAYPVSEHVFNGTNGGFEYGTAHHTPSPPATAFLGTGAANNEFRVDVDTSGVQHPHPHRHAHHHAAITVPSAAPAPAPSILDHSIGGHGHALADNDTITMWSNAPSGFEYVRPLFHNFFSDISDLFGKGSAIGACI